MKLLFSESLKFKIEHPMRFQVLKILSNENNSITQRTGKFTAERHVWQENAQCTILALHKVHSQYIS